MHLAYTVTIYLGGQNAFTEEFLKEDRETLSKSHKSEADLGVLKIFWRLKG